MLDELQETSLMHWERAGRITLDEAVIRAGARSGVRQLVKNKPIGSGCVFQCVNDSSSGYMLSFLGSSEKRVADEILREAVANNRLSQARVDTLTETRRQFLAVLMKARPALADPVVLCMDNLQNSLLFVLVVASLGGFVTVGTMRPNFGPSVFRGAAGSAFRMSEANPLVLFQSFFSVQPLRGPSRRVRLLAAKVSGTGTRSQKGFFMLVSGNQFSFTDFKVRRRFSNILFCLLLF